MHILTTVRSHAPRISREAVVVALPTACLFFGYAYSASGTPARTPEYVNSMTWMAVTGVIVSMPTVGKTAQKAAERCLGTLAGGALGLLCVLSGQPWLQWLFAVLTALVGEIVAVEYKLDYTGKLIPITYLIVTGGGLYSDIPWIVGVVRIAAILSGIMMCFLLSILWFPESSHKQACRQLLDMMKGVQQVATLTWQIMDRHQQQQQQQGESGRQVQQQLQQQSVASDALVIDSGAGTKAVVLPGPDQAHKADLAAAPTTSAIPPDTDLQGSSNANSSKTGNVADSSSGSIIINEVPVPTTAALVSLPGQMVGVKVLDPSAAALQELDDQCEAAMRQTYQSHSALKDSLAAAEAERHICWIGGARVLTPKLLSFLCHMNSSCSSSRSDVGQGQHRHLPYNELTAVGVALRHSMHVWWVLRRLMLDHSQAGNLELLVNTLYPKDLLLSVQQATMAVLDQATDNLAAALAAIHSSSSSRRRRRRRKAVTGKSGASMEIEADPAAQQLQLESRVAELHSHLMLWKQIYMDVNKVRRMAVLRLKSGQDLVAIGEQRQPSAAAGGSDGCHSSDDPSVSAAGQEVEHYGHTPGVRGRPLATRSLADPAVQAVLKKVFTLPDTQEAHMFVMWWHALHLTLQQLDQAFQELAGCMRQLVQAVHGQRSV